MSSRDNKGGAERQTRQTADGFLVLGAERFEQVVLVGEHALKWEVSVTGE